MSLRHTYSAKVGFALVGPITATFQSRARRRIAFHSLKAIVQSVMCEYDVVCGVLKSQGRRLRG